MAILNRIKAAIAQMGPKQFKTGGLMGVDMAAIIQNNVKRPMLFDHLGQKGGVSLVADLHGGAVFLVCGAIGIDIDKGQLGAFGEIPFPHRNRAATEHAYFQK